MPVVSLLLIALSVLFLVLSIQIYCGKTELIMQSHQVNVKDKAAYGMDFGKALFGVSGSLVVSGVLFFSWNLILLATVILIVGLVISFILIALVQKKHNGKIF